VYEKAGTLSAVRRMQDPAGAGQVVKNAEVEKGALEGVVGVKEVV